MLGRLVPSWATCSGGMARMGRGGGGVRHLCPPTSVVSAVPAATPRGPVWVTTPQLARRLLSVTCSHHVPATAAAAAPSASTPPPRLRVVASYLATRVDLARLAKRVTADWRLPDSACKVDKDWLILRIPYADFVGASPTSTPDRGDAGWVHLSISRRGAVVLVNATTPSLRQASPRYDVDALLASDPAITPGGLLAQEYSEDLFVVLDEHGTGVAGGDGGDGAEEVSAARGGAQTAAHASGDGGDSSEEEEGEEGMGAGFAYIRNTDAGTSSGDLVLRAGDLELDMIRIINSCLGQTVNLQHYEVRVDRMYETVQDIFKALEEGWGMRMNTKALYKHLGETSSIANAVMLSGLRSIVRPGSTAWKESRYAQMHEVLWREFDLEDRYEELERRLTWISDTIKYALDVSKDEKSIALERWIVLLISAELAISVAGVLGAK